MSSAKTPEELIQNGAQRLRADYPGLSDEQARWAASVVLKTFLAEWPAIELAAADDDAGRPITNYWWRGALETSVDRERRSRLSVTMACAAGLERAGMKDTKMAFAAALAVISGILGD